MAGSFKVPNFLSYSECNEIVRIAETHASAHGWRMKRHKSYPATDVFLYDVKNQSMMVVSTENS